MPSPSQLEALVARFGEYLNPRPQQTQSIFPAPQRFFDPSSPAYKPMTEQFGATPGGRYLEMGAGGPRDVTGRKPASATVGTSPTGKASFKVSPQDVPQTGTPGRGKVKTNLFKRRAGWDWVGQPPEGYPAQPPSDFPLVSVERGGQHYYGLQADFPKGVDLERYPNAKSEPRLRPTTQGDVYPGQEVGKIAIRGREHPLYDNLTVKGAAGAVPAGLLGAAALGGSEEAEAAPFGTLARELGVPTQEAWHGSPHIFEQDRLLGSKRLTGEGNEAYAAGRYVSLDKGVSKGYRDALATNTRTTLDTPNGAIQVPSDTDYLRETDEWNDFHDRVGGTVSGRYAQLAAKQAATEGIDPLVALERIRQTEYKGLAPDADHQANKWFRDAAQFLSGSSARAESAPGGLYGVEIPEVGQLLDWDAPMSQQPDAVLQPLQSVWSDMYLAGSQGVGLDEIASMNPVQRRVLKERVQVPPLPSGTTGEQLYDQLARELGGKANASEYLRQKGVRGTTYIGVESNARNAVLFDDLATNVVSKDGVPFGGPGTPPEPEVEEIDMGAFADLFKGKGAAAVGTAGLLGAGAASAAEGGDPAAALQAEARQRAEAAYDPVAALRQKQIELTGAPQQPQDEAGQALQASSERLAEQQQAALAKRAQERSGGVVEGAVGLLGQLGEAIPENVRENPLAQFGAELTGVPSVYRAGQQYLEGDVEPSVGLEAASAVVPLVPALRGIRAVDKLTEAADAARRAKALAAPGAVRRPGAEGYPGAPANINQARRTNEPRVEIPRLKSANAGRPKGTIVGTPPGVEPTPENIDRLAAEYAQRVVTGMQHGVEPGYFYQEGNKNLRQWTGGDPYDVARVSGQLAATSPQAPVDTNLLWATRGNEQQAMGYPITTGKSPGQVRKDFQKVEESLSKQRAAGVEQPGVEVGGPKTLPFGQYMNDETALAPNDRWEMFGIGYDRNASFSPQERQMAHYIRQRAQEKLRESGVDLDLDQIQEVHWQAVRGPETNTPMVPGAGDTFQHSAKPLRVQHNWEVAPGTQAQHLPEYYDMDQAGQSAIGERLNRQLIDPQGRDRLVAATGGNLQSEPYRVTRGNFEGFPTEGYKSYSMAPVDKGRAPVGGLEKPTRERLEATEAVRSLALGQTAGSASVRRAGQPSDLANEIEFGLNEPLNTEEVGKLQGALDRVFGPGKVFPEMTPEGVALAHWEDPLRLRAVEGEFNQFGKNVKYKKPSASYPAGAVQLQTRGKAAVDRLRKEYGAENVSVNAKTGIATVKGTRTDWDRALAEGGYSEIADALGSKYNREGVTRNMRDSAFVPLPWEKGTATATALSYLKAPRQRELFDAPEVRGIMGNLASEYKAIQAEGKGTPNPKLVAVLERWAKDGIAGVEDMVKKGLAPAAALGTAVALYNQQGGGAAPQRGDAI